jgi:hypothetical protein
MRALERHRRLKATRHVEFGRGEAEQLGAKQRHEHQGEKDDETKFEFAGAPGLSQHFGAETPGALASGLGELHREIGRYQYCSLLSMFVAAKSTLMLTQTSTAPASIATA